VRGDARLGVVFHLGANADVRFGTDHPRRDLEQNTIATYNVLEAMRTTASGALRFPRPVRSMASRKFFRRRRPRRSRCRPRSMRRRSWRARACWPPIAPGRLPSLYLPLRFHPRRALLARACLRFLQAAAGATRTRCVCSAMAASGSPISTCRIASMQCCWRWTRRRRRSICSIWAPTNSAR